MPVIKQNDKPFVRVPNVTARDKRLKLDEVGALVRLLSCSNNYRFSIDDLLLKWDIGRDKLLRITNGLKAAGYLQIKTKHQPDGQFDGKEWHVFCERQEVPKKEKKTHHDTGNPNDGSAVVRENRSTGKPAHSLKEVEDLKEDIKIEEKEDIVVVEPILKPSEQTAKKEEAAGNTTANRRLVFEYWQQVHGHPTALYTPKDADLVRECFLAGFPIEHLYEAIDGCKASPKHQGQNEHGKIYDSFELIFRNKGANIERFRGYNRTVGKQSKDAFMKGTPVEVAPDWQPNVDPDRRPAPELPIWMQVSWEKICDVIKSKLDGEVFRTWFGSVILEDITQETCIIKLRAGRVTVDWINTYYKELLTEACGSFSVEWEIEN